MDLPEAKGTYILISSVKQVKHLEIGRLGAYDIIPGFYAYVGSAFGFGGLRVRIRHHLESTAAPHWHIDYLLGIAEPIEVVLQPQTQRVLQGLMRRPSSYRLTRELLLNDLAIRSFRDIADQDYVAARLAYHHKLPEPSLWQSQQALEKYLKCILLLHRIPATDIGHSLSKAVERIQESQSLPLDLSLATRSFIGGRYAMKEKDTFQV